MDGQGEGPTREDKIQCGSADRGKTSTVRKAGNQRWLGKVEKWGNWEGGVKILGEDK